MTGESYFSSLVSAVSYSSLLEVSMPAVGAANLLWLMVVVESVCL